MKGKCKNIRWLLIAAFGSCAVWSAGMSHGGETTATITDELSLAAVVPEVPKSLASLQLQTAGKFLTARRGAFLIASDLTEKQFDYVVNGVLACCQSALERSFFTQRPQHAITIYIFKDQESYVAGLKKFFNMAPVSPYGHYGHGKRYIVVNYQTGPGTLVHELTHALMAPDFPAAPIWISEGMASLYEQCRVEGDTLLGEPNWRLPELKKAAAAEKTTPLRELFTSNTKNFRMMRESLNYAQCRYFCLYLQEKGVLAAVYRDFRDHYLGDRSGTAAVEKALGKTLEEIEHDWLQWVARQKWERMPPPAENPEIKHGN